MAKKRQGKKKSAFERFMRKIGAIRVHERGLYWSPGEKKNKRWTWRKSGL